MVKTKAPYGSWTSPVTSKLVTESGVSLGDLQLDLNSSHSTSTGPELAYWVERRTDGRSTICSSAGGQEVTDWTIPAHSVASKVHEYGGGAFLVYNGTVYYVNKDDQYMYMQSAPLEEPVLLGSHGRYADGSVDLKRGNVFCVHEDHAAGEGEGPAKFTNNPITSIVSLDVKSKTQKIAVTGADFYGSPRVSPDGKQLAWVQWNHPNMPWTSTELWTGNLSSDGLTVQQGSQNRVAGGNGVSVLGPQWANDGSLFWLSDESGYYHLYYGDQWSGLEGDGDTNVITELMTTDCARAAWQFGHDHFAISTNNKYIVLATNDPAKGDSLMFLKRGDLGTQPQIIKSPWTTIYGMKLSPSAKLYLHAGHQSHPESLVMLDLVAGGFTSAKATATPSSMKAVTESPQKSYGSRLFGFYERKVNQLLDTVDSYTEGGVQDAIQAVAQGTDVLVDTWYGDTSKVLRKSLDIKIGDGYVCRARHFTFHAHGREAYAYYYAPTNEDFEPMDGELPPLLVKCHGGPTQQTNSVIDPNILYWTSRGVAIVDVNYSGSTGYGKKYRDRLAKTWGIAEVDDVCAAAEYLVSKGRADPNRLMIDGRSAGGYTTLACLTFKDTFKAGCSKYGVSDLSVLAKETHKFESRYLDYLIGPLPEAQKEYYERSPCNSVDKLNCPMIILQGTADKVVPVSQATIMYEAVKAKGMPVSLVMFEGEGHGFIKQENVELALDGEFYFYSQIFDWSLPKDFPTNVADKVIIEQEVVV
ncbi:hypothetical protein SARC_02997 [Sphaeroforma arctica JP610]|uniref:Peptidase S9 prolyl oligopeptidase catalytic domain-containing protein n=1 Tax=Sphaeroforma arctica JP610 TaxID=667725 RepID=A0A0L0G790_9EUKA|nr:hypothetical protein SARC_02997 [Sphaeroforma arctica JP610]KNC84789.1 hypothetical protein SARC_02997 [Sphaeroforma arctica JP610]|eukprot:XP_014158691.1 hypothetical protein SARC_02997 [Sphaeroforma arctica JP610]